jgi:hypothetical protein
MPGEDETVRKAVPIKIFSVIRMERPARKLAYVLDSIGRPSRTRTVDQRIRISLLLISHLRSL